MFLLYGITAYSLQYFCHQYAKFIKLHLHSVNDNSVDQKDIYNLNKHFDDVCLTSFSESESSTLGIIERNTYGYCIEPYAFASKLFSVTIGIIIQSPCVIARKQHIPFIALYRRDERPIMLCIALCGKAGRNELCMLLRFHQVQLR